jgi:hypothetical protein
MMSKMVGDTQAHLREHANLKVRRREATAAPTEQHAAHRDKPLVTDLRYARSIGPIREQDTMLNNRPYLPAYYLMYFRSRVSTAPPSLSPSEHDMTAAACPSFLSYSPMEPPIASDPISIQLASVQPLAGILSL